MIYISAVLHCITKCCAYRRAYNKRFKQIKISNTLLLKMKTVLHNSYGSKAIKYKPEHKNKHMLGGGYIVCYLSESDIVERIRYLREISSDVDNEVVLNELNYAISVLKHVRINGPLRFRYYFYRRRRYISKKVNMRSHLRSLVQYRKKLWFTKKKKFKFYVKNIGRSYYLVKTKKYKRLYKNVTRKRHRRRIYNLYERCIMGINKIAFSGKRLYKIKMRAKLRKQYARIKYVDRLYIKSLSKHFVRNVLSRKRSFRRIKYRILKPLRRVAYKARSNKTHYIYRDKKRNTNYVSAGSTRIRNVISYYMKSMHMRRIRHYRRGR